MFFEHDKQRVSLACVTVFWRKDLFGEEGAEDGEEEGGEELRLGVHGLMQRTVWMGEDALHLLLSQLTSVGQAIEGPSNGKQNGMVLKNVLGEGKGEQEEYHQDEFHSGHD